MCVPIRNEGGGGRVSIGLLSRATRKMGVSTVGARACHLHRVRESRRARTKCKYNITCSATVRGGVVLLQFIYYDVYAGWVSMCVHFTHSDGVYARSGE